MTPYPGGRRVGGATFFFKRQGWHVGALLVLVPVAWALAAGAMGDGSWLGISDVAWFWLAAGNAILQQILTWLVWRGQLVGGVFTRLFGHLDLVLWGALFLPLLAARPLFIFGLAMADAGSLMLPSWISVVLGLALLVPSLYTLWSVARYFGIPRSLGGDHFRAAYRAMPLVKEGAFAWSGNAMYAYGFLGLWSIALLLESQAALSAALFQHAYVWVHYYCTEEPDIEILYGTGSVPVEPGGDAPFGRPAG